MEELISVIITTYKRNYNTLNRAIKSVYSQSYKNIQLIVVIDTPLEDPTYLEVSKGLNEYKDRISVLSTGGTKGACFARNLGASKAEGIYLAFLDDDDYWDKDKIIKQYNVMQNGDYSIVSCKSHHVTNEGVEIRNIGSIIGKVGHLFDAFSNPTKKKLLRYNCIGGCSYPLLNKKYYDLVGGFDESLPRYQDFDLWIRMVNEAPATILNEKLVYFTSHSGERISNSSDKHINALIILLEKYKDYKNIWEFRKCSFYKIAREYYRLKEPIKANEFMKEARKVNGLSRAIIYYYILARIEKKHCDLK